MPDVAIAIVSYNTRALLDECLTSLRADADAGRAEVWVVDNASTDGSADMVAAEHPWANLIRSGENLGYGPAVNVVADRTTTAWVAPANSDLSFTPGAIEALLGAGAAHPEAAAIAPRLILPDGSTQQSVQPFPSVTTSLLTASRAASVSAGARRRLYLPGAWDPDVGQDVPWATGAFLIVRREAWQQVGGFDAEQWMYAEDLDLGWRLAEAGWTTRYEPRAVVHHHESAASKVAFGGQAGVVDKWVKANNAWMVRRQGLARTWASSGIAATEAGLRVAALSVLARCDADRFGEKLAWAQRDLRGARAGLKPRSELLKAR
jgi:N-acetylglucosaminyl-diphospho-decaprenol L-rhamnosyltransferase